MAEFKKRDQNKLYHSPLVLAVLFCVIVIFAYNMVGLIKKERETAEKRALVLDQINALNMRQKSLSSDISKLETNEGVEEAIRDKYQVVKPGEKMLVVVDDKNITSASPDTASTHGFWNWFKNLFK